MRWIYESIEIWKILPFFFYLASFNRFKLFPVNDIHVPRISSHNHALRNAVMWIRILFFKIWMIIHVRDSPRYWKYTKEIEMHLSMKWMSNGTCMNTSEMRSYVESNKMLKSYCEKGKEWKNVEIQSTQFDWVPFGNDKSGMCV